LRAMLGPLLVSDVGEELMHTLLVISAGVVLVISVSAFARKRTSRYFFLMLAFSFLLLSQIDSLYETLFLSDTLVVVPLLDLHLAHLLILAMILSFGVAIIPRQVRGGEESGFRTL
jgi:hypothetical protein